ncbi:MAG: hypothetical protein JWN62_1815 [Acidimicrobiales bacterium]|nr:hypothetical protein [Acidimicrobiales bacterium]
MEIVARASIVFWFVFLLTRGLKRRSLGDMAPFEMILLVVLGDIIQQGVMQQDYSVTGAVLALATFGFWISVMTFLTWKSKKARLVLEGVPIVLVSNGKPIDRALAVEHMPLAEVLEAARQQGVDDLAKIRLAVLEVSGRISIITE